MPLLHVALDRAQRLLVPARYDLAFNSIKGRVLGSGEPEEGHELSTLKGAIRTIEMHRPLCLVEVVDRDREALTAFFDERRYNAHSRWNGVEISGHNKLFASVC